MTTAAKKAAPAKAAATKKADLPEPEATEERDESAAALPCVEVQLGSCPNALCPLHLHVDQVAGRDEALAPPA